MAFDYVGVKRAKNEACEEWETTLKEGNKPIVDESRYEMHIFVCSSDMKRL